MSKKNEGGSEGGQTGPSEAVENGLEAMLPIVRHIAETAIGQLEKLEPDAQTQLALRDDEERAKFLDELVLNLAPATFDMPQLIRWLNGGPSPFPRKGVEKVGKDSEWPSQTLVRASPRVGRHQRKIESLRAELADEEQKLQYAQAHERAAIQWFVTDHLISLISPVFAMGPAWTFLRALSAHLPAEVAEDATDALYGKEKDVIIGRMRAERAAETEQMLKTLDYLSGVVEFEEALRAAVLNVVKEFGEKGDGLVKDGRRPRSKEAIRTSINPKAQNESDEVLDGLRPAA